jgi:hypothetical protein
VVSRIVETVGHVANTLSGNGKVFDSVLGNVEQLVNLLPALNMADDPIIAQVTEEIRTQVLSADIKAIKKNPEVKAEVAKAAQAVVDKMAAFFP